MKLVICHNILRNINFLVKCFIFDKVKQETITQFLLYLTERVNYSNTNMENVRVRSDTECGILMRILIPFSVD